MRDFWQISDYSFTLKVYMLLRFNMHDGGCFFSSMWDIIKSATKNYNRMCNVLEAVQTDFYFAEK